VQGHLTSPPPPWPAGTHSQTSRRVSGSRSVASASGPTAPVRGEGSCRLRHSRDDLCMVRAPGRRRPSRRRWGQDRRGSSNSPCAPGARGPPAPAAAPFGTPSALDSARAPPALRLNGCRPRPCSPTSCTPRSRPRAWWPCPRCLRPEPRPPAGARAVRRRTPSAVPPRHHPGPHPDGTVTALRPVEIGPAVPRRAAARRG
jgi:hypothetical protein